MLKDLKQGAGLPVHGLQASKPHGRPDLASDPGEVPEGVRVHSQTLQRCDINLVLRCSKANLRSVECAVKSVFRMTRLSADPLFPTLAKATKLMHHFLFISQSFVSTLSAYVFDTAIGGNFDPFLEQLAAESRMSQQSSASPALSKVRLSVHTGAGPKANAQRLSDVFELAASHSELLDRILTACLLRSGQKAVAELLKQTLELILEFCVIIGELQRGRLKEWEASGMVEDVYKGFKSKMSTFVSA